MELSSSLCDYYALVYMFDSQNDYCDSPMINEMYEKEENNDELGLENLEWKLVVKTSSLTYLQAKYNIFNGFDQLYIFKHREDIVNIDMHITSGSPITQKRIEQNHLADLIIDNKISLAIGDGYGVNYLTTDSKIAEIVDRLHFE